MKFPMWHGTGETQGSQKKARGCYLASTKQIKAQVEAGSIFRGPEGFGDRNVCTLEVPEEIPKKGQLHEEIQSVLFDERDPAKVFKIGMTLGAEHEAMLTRVLREYRDVFAWEPKDMPGVDPEVLAHRLYVIRIISPSSRRTGPFRRRRERPSGRR
ncbi:hypothetical protein LIER_05401 [Lithospermum erythrorhizon]|uniref:Uncharacterized protein n=1 Tax=Lithospermum erythrorhizon TaxID=34254 RepID=A0AAV3P576_LITER